MNDYTTKLKIKLNNIATRIAREILNQNKEILNPSQKHTLNNIIKNNDFIIIKPFNRKFLNSIDKNTYNNILPDELLTHHIYKNKAILLFLDSPVFINKINAEDKISYFKNIIVKEIFNMLINIKNYDSPEFESNIKEALNEGVIEYYSKQFCNENSIDYVYNKNSYNLNLANMFLETMNDNITKEDINHIIFNGSYVDIITNNNFGVGLCERHNQDYESSLRLDDFYEDIISKIDLVEKDRINFLIYMFKGADLNSKYYIIKNIIETYMPGSGLLDEVDKIYNGMHDELYDINYYKQNVIYT